MSVQYVQAQPFTIAGAGSNLGDTSIILTSMQDINGVNLTMADFGTIAYGTLEPGSGLNEEQISFSGITQNGGGTATLTGVKTVLFKSPYTETSGLAKSHAGGVTFIITNTAGFYNKLANKTDNETISGAWTFPSANIAVYDSHPSFSANTQIVDKKYVDDSVTAGAPNASTTTKGIVQEATVAQINAGTASGSTGAELYVQPASLLSSNYGNFLPTTTQKDALAGTGTPSGSNKYVTADTNALNQLLSNLSTSTNLGTSNTLYPSQNAVKSYVDSAPRFSYKTSATTYAGDTASGTQTIAHGLGRTPAKVNITATKSVGNLQVANSFGAYDGSTNACVFSVYYNSGNAALSGNSTTAGVIIQDDNSSTVKQSGVITVDSTNITITWTKTGSPTSANINILWEVE